MTHAARANAAFLTGIVAVFAGLGALSPAVAVPPDAIAVVNGRPISRRDFGLALVRSLGRSALDSMVDRVLISQQAAARGITVSEGELRERAKLERRLKLRRLIRNARMGPEEFWATVRRQGIDPDQVRQELRDSVSQEALEFKLLAEKMLAETIEITPERLRRYFEETRGGRMLAAHIMVGSQEQARHVLETLREEPGKWTDLVRTVSLDRASVRYKGRLPPVPASSELGQALQGMDPGGLKLYQSDRGWHVLRLIGTVPPSGEEFEQVREELEKELLCELAGSRADRWLAELHAAANVVTNLSANPQSRAVLGEDVAAYVNGEPVSVRQLGEALIEEFAGRLLGPYIERELIFQEARRRQITVSEQEVQGRLEELAQQVFEEHAAAMDMDAAQLRDFVESNGTDAGRFMEELMPPYVTHADVRALLLAEKAVADGVEVNEQEIKEAYSYLYGERIDAREIVVNSKAKAEQLIEDIGRGTNFGVLVRAESVAPGAWLNGGLVRNITAAHPYHAHLKNVAEGRTTCFNWRGKYRILRVMKRWAPVDPPPFDSARDWVRQQLVRKKTHARIVAWIEKLKAEATIETNLK